ncbi:hypothetical protein Pelo_4496 [Pelomyxa schiedti]|nr:hypothetical protein Pelo_4496 [Pelomyxa schiedti]
MTTAVDDYIPPPFTPPPPIVAPPPPIIDQQPPAPRATVPSPSPASATAASSAALRAAFDGRKARQVARELVTTENSFVAMMSKYRLYTTEAKRLITREQYVAIFGSMKRLLAVHARLSEQFSGLPEETLVPDLLVVFKQWMKTDHVFEVYMHIVHSVPEAHQVSSSVKASNPGWKKFLEDLDYSMAMNGLNLECLIKGQVCRIPRYILLFQDLKKQLGGVPCPDLDLIIATFREIAEFFNAALRVRDLIEEALELAPKLIHYKGVWPPKRELRMHLEAILPKSSQKSTAFLLSDIMLACNNTKKKHFLSSSPKEPTHYDVVIQLQYSEGLYEVYHGPVRKHPNPKEVGKWWAPVCIRRTADTPTSTTACGTATATGKGTDTGTDTGTGTGTGNKGTRAGSVGLLLHPPAAAAVLQLVDFRGENITRFVESLARLCYQSFDWRGSAAAFVACSLPRVGARCPAAASLNAFCLSEIAHCLFDFRALKSPFEVPMYPPKKLSNEKPVASVSETKATGSLCL